jgi:hypothetical protein
VLSEHSEYTVWTNIYKNGLRQWDGLACPLFHKALNGVISDVGINIRGSTVHKPVQFLAYDDTDIMGRTQGAIKEAFIGFKTLAKRMHLQINLAKTKYTPMTKKSCAGGQPFLLILNCA